MAQTVIENPVINSPFQEPRRHFKFSDDGITNEIVEGRRVSSYFMPVPGAKKRGKQLLIDTEWTQDRLEENKFINQVRGRVAEWRHGGHVGVTRTTARLLEYWSRPGRERPLFFCQIEALETVIYLTEIAPKVGDAWIDNQLREANAASNPELFRIAFKMATGSGKTVVMAMLIAWHALNKLADPRDDRFSDTFLVVTPGITIRDRLRVLLPNDPDNYYRKMDVIPAGQLAELHQAKVLIANFHGFLLRERASLSKVNKAILRGWRPMEGEPGVFTETPDQMVRRVCRELGNKRKIVVLNDEAHHCYRRKPDAEAEKLTVDDRREATKREEEARVWISGLEAVKRKIGIRALYDLSATPFFLRGSGYSEGTLFPWVVSDFSLIDAIESGIVKVPRVPVADDSMTGDQPVYRDLWVHVRDGLPKKGRKTEALAAEPNPPKELAGALYSLYGNYEKYYRQWEAVQEANGAAASLTPPVFIVVCSNTNVSKLVFDWIAGWEKTMPGGESVLVPGKLNLFSNVGPGGAGEGRWISRPNTILVDSSQLESDEAMAPEFKKIAAVEIEEFKNEYRERFPGRDVDSLTDEDLLREVMNTIGKPGKLGEQVKCVVSVSMLTEGWDANTVSHILGVRAFSTQLLCEQVVGRGLRRTNYTPNEDGMLTPEYAEVYGVPFSFIPCSGSQADPKPRPMPTRVRALDDRMACEITFPRLVGYRWELPSEKLSAEFDDTSRFVLSTQLLPTHTENWPIVGERTVDTLDGLKAHRLQEVAFGLAKLTLERYFRADDGADKPWLFPQLLRIAREWLDAGVICKDNCFKQMLLLEELAYGAADCIHRAIARGEAGAKRLKPILRPYDTTGSTRYVDFDTTRPVYITDPEKCQISHVVADTDSWEQKMAQVLEDMPEVVCYAKNQNLGFWIPYTWNGEEKNYQPDFIARVRDGAVGGDAPGAGDLLNLIVEVSGEARPDKAVKTAAARDLWATAVNNHGGFGRWGFLEITDPWDAANTIRAYIASSASEG